MNILKKILIVVVVLAALIVVIGYLLPRKVHVERSIVINASPDAIWQEVKGVKRMNNWTPWMEMDPNMKLELSGPDYGIGSRSDWDSEDENVGKGSQEIVESVENEKVRMEMYFSDFPDPNYAEIILTETDGGTNVLWTYDGDLGSGPMFRYFGLMLDGMLGPNYEQGLAKLKSRVEGRPQFTASITDQNADPINYLGIQQTYDMTKPESVGPMMGMAYGKIGAFMGQNSIEMAGMPMSVNISQDEASWTAITAMPIAAETAGNDEIQAGATTGGMVVKAVHMGDYHKMGETHDQVAKYLEHYGLEVAGNNYEIYVTDPGVVTDTAQWQTDIYYPVK